MSTSCGSDTVVEEDLAEFFELLDEDFFNNDEFSNSCLESIVDDAAKVENVIKCDQCEKTYKSKQGLSRHKNSKRPTIKKDKLHPATYKKFVNDAARKLSQDNCYSDDTKQQLSSFEWTLDQAIESFQHIKTIVADYNGNAEKFYPLFFDIYCSKPLFPSLSRKCGRILGIHVSSHIVPHLYSSLSSISSSSSSSGSTSSSTPKIIRFTEKEKNIIFYLSGYVFHTVFTKLKRASNKLNWTTKQMYFDLLLAGKKMEDDEFIRPNEKLVNVKDRGGLWRMDKSVIGIFEECEEYFRINVVDKDATTNIDANSMVDDLLKNTSILASMSTLRNKCSQVVDEESSLNLLQDLLTLYFRTRTFSYVKQKCDQFKFENKKQKMKSLRTSIKKASATLDMGH